MIDILFPLELHIAIPRVGMTGLLIRLQCVILLHKGIRAQRRADPSAWLVTDNGLPLAGLLMM